MVDLPGRPSRRSFLKATVASAAVTSIPIGLPHAKAAELPSLEDYKPVYFDAAEWSFILAACARLIPSDGTGPGAIETRVPVFIDLQMAGDFGKAADWYMEGPYKADANPLLGFQSPLAPAEIYRKAIPVFQDWCKQTHGDAFEKLDAETQDAALTSLEKGGVKLDPELRDFFSFLLQNTKEGYFADPMYGGNQGMQAWVHIGFPGARGSYAEWVNNYNAEYPLGPVSISGERA
ncbi:gluconate 2-dehydrogenase gamma chain [Breoghania corrubedonensis]|uniref:Gluconate 2-dehydrogenase gamma chain n=1 Tax=Breoghania corrubedonensis TaxID=665038 RepID=A0A2T5VF44_9HYPH|nr:gluconate 2-dehydrogenase subunit 3 family protein [Breoghania corrubedonensis]PTW62368.1 gluconate 2-dehydrogenase gamma chain [Breoghania corrubedonensis]